MAGTVVVVPCYNEERRLPAAALKDFLRRSEDVTLVFVDDGSTDGTLAVLRGIEQAEPSRTLVVTLARNAGKAEAVRSGMLRALQLDPDYAGFWDADLATPLEAIAAFRGVLEAHEDLDLVMGARVRLLGRRIERKAARHYLGRVAATAISLTLGLGVYDTQCGAKLFRATPTLRDLFAEPFLARWGFDVEIIARLLRARGPEGVEDRIYEYPLVEWTDVGESKLRASDYLHSAVELWRIHRRYLRGVPSSRS